MDPNGNIPSHYTIAMWVVKITFTTHIAVSALSNYLTTDRHRRHAQEALTYHTSSIHKAVTYFNDSAYRASPALPRTRNTLSGKFCKQLTAPPRSMLPTNLATQIYINDNKYYIHISTYVIHFWTSVIL